MTTLNSEKFELLARSWVQVEPAAKLSSHMHTAAIVLRLVTIRVLSYRGKTMVSSAARLWFK